MITAIKEIGAIVSAKDISNGKRIEGKVLTISFGADNSAFQEIEVEDFDVERLPRYLYKEGASKANSPAPFAQITEPSKTFNKKIRKWLAECETMSGIENKEFEFLNNINQVLRDKETEIIDAIINKLANLNLPKKDKKFLTVKLEGGKNFLGDYDIFKKAVGHFANEKSKKSSASGNVCSVCGELRDNVSGKTDVFKFYTIDKPGFIAGGFKEPMAWKNFPVCDDCKTLLEKGRGFIDSKLNFRFYGLSYSLIPRILAGKADILEEIINILSDATQTVSLKDRIKKRITSDENEILEFLADKRDVLTLNFLFLQRQQSAERILLLIEDVFPSRIRAIFNAKDEVDNTFNEDFNFGKIRTFFSKSDEGKRESDLNKYFLEIVDSVFKGNGLNFSFLTKFHMTVIRKEFINDKYFTFRVIDAMMNTMFFEKLGLINFEEGVNMEESSFGSIFNRFGKSLNTSAKRGVFLLGALTQLLLNKQWTDRNSKPFMKKLKSLKMDERDIKSLLPEVQNKLEEYDSFDKGKRVIAAEMSTHLLDAGEGWKMSVDEINYYFANGMNLYDEIATIAYKKEG
jgi:CRISPR-associated protein Csh1